MTAGSCVPLIRIGSQRLARNQARAPNLFPLFEIFAEPFLVGNLLRHGHKIGRIKGSFVDTEARSRSAKLEADFVSSDLVGSKGLHGAFDRSLESVDGGVERPDDLLV